MRMIIAAVDAKLIIMTDIEKPLHFQDTEELSVKIPLKPGSQSWVFAFVKTKYNNKFVSLPHTKNSPVEIKHLFGNIV